MAAPANVESESGTKSANAEQIADSSASSGNAVKFTGDSDDSCPYRFPTPSCVGLPSGWTSTATYTADRIISTDNATVENITMDGAVLYITGDNVTVRNVRFINGAGLSTERNNYCAVNTVVEDSTFSSNGADWLAPGLDGTVEMGGYTLRRVHLDGVYEALRVGGRIEGCGPVIVEKSYIHVVYPPECSTDPGVDWHGDGIQFYDGNYSSITDSVIWMDIYSPSHCEGTAPYFLADQCNTGSPSWNTTTCDSFQPWYNNTLAAHGGVMADVNGLIVKGGGYAFRTYLPTKVDDLYIINNSWVFGPRDAACGDVTAGWDAHLATLDGNGQPIVGATVACGTG